MKKLRPLKVKSLENTCIGLLHNPPWPQATSGDCGYHWGLWKSLIKLAKQKGDEKNISFGEGGGKCDIKNDCVHVNSWRTKIVKTKKQMICFLVFMKKQNKKTKQETQLSLYAFQCLFIGFSAFEWFAFSCGSLCFEICKWLFQWHMKASCCVAHVSVFNQQLKQVCTKSFRVT